MNNQAFSGQVVWITGASRGIGAALAHAFAAQGARLILSAPPAEEAILQEVLCGCPCPEQHLSVPFDLGDPSSIEAAFAEVASKVTRIHVLVNNAGITHRGMILDTAMSVHRRVMEVNYFGTIDLTQRAVRHMVQSDGGKVVMLSSILGLMATPQRSAYVAAKHALTGYIEALRAETTSQGIQILAVFPGFVKTDIAFHALTANGQQHGVRDAGQQGAMSPEKLAARILVSLAANESRLMAGGKELLLPLAYRLSHALHAWIVRRVKVT